MPFKEKIKIYKTKQKRLMELKRKIIYILKNKRSEIPPLVFFTLA